MQIKSQIKSVSVINYPVLDENLLTETILPTLNDILVIISPKFKDNLKSVALISSIVTTVASSRYLCFKLPWDCLSEKRKPLKISKNMD